jgi:DNA-binding NarL/FixJ family response regulator
MTKIFLVDDHAILRDGLKYILSAIPEFEVVGEAGDGREAISRIERLRPDIVVLDISLPSMSGVEVARQLGKFVPDTKIIILSRHDNEEYVQELLAIGVSGYILKEGAGDDLIKAINEVIQGNIYLSPRITKKVISDFMLSRTRVAGGAPGDPMPLLSNREKEILKLIAEGKTGDEIASILRIAANTVKVHRMNIMQKLEVHNTVDLVKYAIRKGLIEI